MAQSTSTVSMPDAARLAAAARKAEQFMLSEFGQLRADQLNWRSDAESWSIGQCLEHIIQTDILYFPAFEKILAGEYRMTPWQRWSPLSGMFGRMLVDQLGEVATKKLRSPRAFRPGQQAHGSEIITRFSKHQDTLLQFLDQVSASQMSSLRLASPAAPLVTYSLGHALQMIVQHQYRHLNQALRVKAKEGFPR